MIRLISENVMALNQTLKQSPINLSRGRRYRRLEISFSKLELYVENKQKRIKKNHEMR